MKNTQQDTTLDRAELNARLLNNSLAHETKLNILKEALETNTYCMNSNRIAEGLLEYADEPSKTKETEPA
jgi:anti-sigma28 factor (negative regulator of flagellin synthesis)